MPKLFKCGVFAVGLALALAGASARADDAKTGTMQGGAMSSDPMTGNAMSGSAMQASPMSGGAMSAGPMADDPMKADCMEKAGKETDADKKAAALAACDAMGGGMMMNQMAPAK